MKVFTNYNLAGELSRADYRFQFAYHAASEPAHAVSLIMPVRQEPYLTTTTRVIHPIFDMNIPEGYLYEKLREMFSRALPVVDKLSMLELIGRSQIGRVRVAESVGEIKNIPARPLKEALVSHGTAELFAELLKNYARFSGVAGVQPKVLAKDDGSLAGMTGAGLFSQSTISKAPAKVTFHGTTHIVKMADPDVFPAITTNEYLCLLAAKRAGLPAPAVWLSRNRQCLVIERFDIKPDGTYLAFEDICALRNMQSEEKYFATCEQAARTLTRHIAAAHTRDMRTFFEADALSVCLRNGDAHLKNFGVLYDEPGAAWLAPAYDIVTTTVYLEAGVLALGMGGTKQWPATKTLLNFGMSECALSRQQARESLAKIVDAVETVRHEIPAHINDSATKPERAALARMDAQWQAGIASLTRHLNPAAHHTGFLKIGMKSNK